MSALTADESAYMAADKPVLIAANALDTTTSAKWTTDGSLASTDKTETNYPIKRVYDRHQHLVTKPDSALTTWYLCFDLGADVADFDMLAIAGHNFGAHSAAVTVYLQSGTSSTFSSFANIVGLFGNTTAKRVVYFLPDRKTSTRYVRLLVQSSNALIPEIGELWLGRRRHLPYKFDRQLDDLRTGSELVAFESRSGIRTNYTLSRGQSRRTGSMLLDQASDIATVEAFWSESAQGTKPFLYCENPSTAASTTQLMNQDPELDLALVGPRTRSFGLNMREVAPFVALES